MKKLKMLCAVLTGAFAFTQSNAADLKGRLLINPYLGYHIFDGERKLDNTFEFGVGFEKFISNKLGVEAYLGYMSTDHWYKKKKSKSKSIFAYNFSASYNFNSLSRKLVPYLTVGLGSNEKMIPGFNYGFGLRYFLKGKWGIKAEMRHFYIMSGDNDLGMLLGLSYIFGERVNLKERKIEEETIDSDGDGIADNFDQCPDTPAGVTVDEFGCPLDSDSDGVADYQDKCPFTPEGIEVNEEGCPKDSDNDGVPDYLDKCPDTKEGVPVYSDGCPLDSDNDGVPDYQDNCPDTALGIPVDSNGCPLDSDKDDVPDFLDRCPNTPPGAKVDKNGCMQSITLRVYFDPNSTKVKPEYYDEIAKLAIYLKEHPNVKVEIQGHTDRTPNSSYSYNIRLSQKRAEAVKRVLVERFGISPDRIIAKGYGFTKPIAPNDTPEGRAKNRRVEVVVIKR